MRKSKSEKEKWKQNIDNICATDIRKGDVTRQKLVRERFMEDRGASNKGGIYELY